MGELVRVSEQQLLDCAPGDCGVGAGGEDGGEDEGGTEGEMRGKDQERKELFEIGEEENICREGTWGRPLLSRRTESWPRRIILTNTRYKPGGGGTS